MGKRKPKPLLAVQGIIHLNESFVQPTLESGLLNTVGGDIECQGLILAPNYGYAIPASSLITKSDAQEHAVDSLDDIATDLISTDHRVVDKLATSTTEERSTDIHEGGLSIAQLVRRIGGAKDKPILPKDIVEDRPESYSVPPQKYETDDAETAKFYESLGIERPTHEPEAKNDGETNEIEKEDMLMLPSVECDGAGNSIANSIAEYYKNYPTQYVYSVESEPYGSKPLEFNLPISSTIEHRINDVSPSIIEIARRAQKTKREYETRKAALEKMIAKGELASEQEDTYDPLPMEIVFTGSVESHEPHSGASSIKNYWERVQEDPHDFNTWTFLINYGENLGNLHEIRKIYSGFLPLFPYCFGYWKRYSDIEKNHYYLQRALTILLRGLEFIPLCVDLWMSYLSLFAEVYAHNKDFNTLLRQEYELAISSCGMDFRSDSLWDSYIQWEMNLKSTKSVFVLYKRLLQVPTRLYNRHWDNCKALIRDLHPRDFLSYDDYEKIRRNGCKFLKLRYKPEPEIEDGEIKTTKKPEDKLMDYVKEKVLAKLSKIQTATSLQTEKRWDFEDKIRRPYFHVKPLDKAQLYNWDEYLNFECKEGSHDRIVLLFERCLISCARYERFWCKYARYVEKYYRANPEVEYSVHLQPSKVNVEIVSKQATEEEENIVSTVESTLHVLVLQVIEEEANEIMAVEQAMGSMLAELDESSSSVTPILTIPLLDEVSTVPVELCGHSECKNAELPPNTGTDDSSSSDFAALISLPKLPPPTHHWNVLVRDIYTRASLVHCPRKPTIRLQWAAFEEEIGNADAARELIQYVFEWYPNHLEAKIQLLDLERRNNNFDTVVKIYEDLIKTSKSQELISMVSLKYARFLFKEMGCPDQALKVLRVALKKDSGNYHLYSHVYEICYHRYPSDKKGAYAALELATRAEKLPLEQKLMFARKRVHFYQEHSDLLRYRNALDELYDIEAIIRRKEEEELKWKEFETCPVAQKSVITRSLQPFPIPTCRQEKQPQAPVPIDFETINGLTVIKSKQVEVEDIGGSTDVGPSNPYATVPPIPEYLDTNYGYSAKHPDSKLVELLGHKEYESIESKGYPEIVKDTPEDLEVLKERKRKNPLFIVPPRGSYYVNSDTDVPGEAKRSRLQAPVLLSQLITPNSSPCINVPDWFIKEGGELCISETRHGFSVIRYWPHFLSEDGNTKMFKRLRKSVKWHQKQILTTHGSWRHIPRLVSWLGPCDYSHTGMVMKKCDDWTPEILDLLHRLVQLVNYEFNSCSLNLYRTGHDSNAWHADIHPALGSNPPIASISLGALRTFEMKRKGLNSTNYIRFPLFPGSLLIMEGATQVDWLHQVPKEPSSKAERLNLTFRIMHALEDDDPNAIFKAPHITVEETRKEISSDTESKIADALETDNTNRSTEKIDPLLMATFPPEEDKPKDPPKPWEIQAKIRFRN